MITKEAIEAACAALNKRDKGNAISIPDVVAMLTAAFAAMPGPAVKVKVKVKFPSIGTELYERYSVMSAQTHEFHVKEYARGVATDLQAENDRLLAALLECDEYFDNRADADCDQDGYIPNAEMKMLTIVRAALERT